MKTIIYISLLFMGIVFAEEQVDTNESNGSFDESVLSDAIEELTIEKKIIATRSDIKVIESSEDIIYISQQMVKDYLFLSVNPNNIRLAAKLKYSLSKLNDNLKIIARTTKNSDTKDLLDYLAYSKDEISEILKDKIGTEQSASMLDYSETLLEGGQSMISAGQYDFTNEEKMLSTTKKIEYLLSKITKYYFANNLGFDTDENQELMQASILELGKNFEKIHAYTYPNEIENVKDEIDKVWKVSKVFFDKSKKSVFIPSLMFVSMNYLEKMVDKLTSHHRKNQ